MIVKKVMQVDIFVLSRC